MKVLDRLDDLMNPIVVKELRQAVQSKLVSGALLLFLAVQLLVLGTIVLNRESRGGGNLDFSAGREAFQIQQATLFGACLLLIPLYGGVRLALERADANADLLFISALKPRSIVAGKLIALVALTLLIFSTCAPFMTFTYLLRGLDIPTIVLVLGIDFCLVVLAIQFALLLAVLPLTRWLHVLVGLLALGLSLSVLSGAAEISSQFLRAGTGAAWDWNFWAGVLTTVGCGLGLVGLFFVGAVALISPPAANRALLPRAYLVFLWLATGAVAVAWAYKESTPEPLLPWTLLMTMVFCAYLGVAINERDNWGPRVARWIPRRPLFRAQAFLLYSGSAGGIAFAVLFVAATFAISIAVQACYPSTHTLERHHEFLEANLVMSLYVFNYGVAAVLCRTWLLRRWLKPIQTWVVAVGLLVVGVSLPPMLAFLFFRDSFNRSHETPWWFLPNPFWAFQNLTMFRDVFGGRSQLRALQLGFSVGWALLVVAAAVPWFFAQFRRFRAPTPRI